MSEEIEKFILEDGRKAEKSIVENKINESEKEIITEIRSEETRPLKAQKRIIEKVKPFIYERVVETIDQNTGEVLERTVEDVITPTENNYTKEEIIKTIINALKDKEHSKLKSLGIIEEIEKQEEEEASKENKFSIKDISLMTIIIAQILGLIYLLFLN